VALSKEVSNPSPVICTGNVAFSRSCII